MRGVGGRLIRSDPILVFLPCLHSVLLCFQIRNTHTHVCIGPVTYGSMTLANEMDMQLTGSVHVSVTFTLGSYMFAQEALKMARALRALGARPSKSDL